MQDCFPRWVLPDLVNIILDYSKELPVKRVHLEQDTITNDDIPLDVTNLIISNCTNFQVTDEFENIMTLEFTNSIVQNIPSMPKLTWLKCNNCHVETLGSLPKCEILHGNCNRIHSIENLKSIKSLNLSSNTSLKTLPDIPNCTWLNINETKIQEILQPLDKCKVFQCRKMSCVYRLTSLTKVIH